jgi:hypothetical protein
MLTESRYFYSLTRLPVAPFDRYLRVKQFITQMAGAEDAILAVLVNKEGDEFTLSWPKAASAAEHDQIVRFFWRSHASCWTNTKYSDQSPRAICDPRIWFYENVRPVAE